MGRERVTGLYGDGPARDTDIIALVPLREHLLKAPDAVVDADHLDAPIRVRSIVTAAIWIAELSG